MSMAAMAPTGVSNAPNAAVNAVGLVAVSGELGADGATDVLVSLQPPKEPPTGVARAPADIVCVIDVSGSMGAEATVQNDQGVNEAMGLSVLDVVKHAVKTIYTVLQPCDRLAIVKYSNAGEVAMQLTPMDDVGRGQAESCVDNLHPGGGTNIWAGLLQGLEVARSGAENRKKEGRFAHLLLLTDGCPTRHPEKGPGMESEMLKDYQEKNQTLPCTVSTFGFGYSLQSVMLKEVAMEGRGAYGFIPDSGLVGTIFVNAISNLLTTMAHNVVLSLEPGNNAEFVEDAVLGNFPHVSTSWGLSLNVGSLHYGQSRDFVVRMRLTERSPSEESSPYLSATLTYKACSLDGAVEERMTEAHLSTQEGGTILHSVMRKKVLIEATRLDAATAISRALHIAFSGEAGPQERIVEAQQIIKAAADTIRNSTVAQDAQLVALLEDLDGQVMEALSRVDWFQKWGRHYLPSLVGAHLGQMCNNFKDPGVQLYGGTLFEGLRDAADEIFVKLPPPKPSGRRPSATPVDMSRFYNCGGGCFDGESLVLMANGSQTALKHAVRGDRVMTSSGPAEIACVVRTSCTQGLAELVELPGGLLATPWHPVRVDGAWCFPCHVAQPAVQSCTAVYNLVLSGGHASMFVCGVECVVLGHGLEDPVAAHAYFGTRRVVEDLQRMPGWQEGLVELTPMSWVREAATQKVCGIHAPDAAAKMVQ